MLGATLTAVAKTGEWVRSARSQAQVRGSLSGFQGAYLLGLVLIVVAYYGAAQLGFAFKFAGPVAAIVWLPAGVGIAGLYIAGLQFWPAVLVGDLLVNNYSALPVGVAVAQTAGNVIEIVVAAGLLLRFKPRGSPLDTVHGVALMLSAIALGTGISAAIGALSLLAGDVLGNQSVFRVWRTWWLGDASGALIVLPVALAWWNRASPTWLKGRALEGALMLTAVVGLSQLALNIDSPLSYLVFPALIWAALRFGPRGASIAVLLAAGFAIWGTTHYHGPFAFESITRNVLATQIYIAVAAVSTLTLAAVVAERQALDWRLRASRRRLIAAGDIVRRKLERDLHDGAQQRLVALAAHLTLSAREAEQTPSRAAALFESAEAELAEAIDELRALAHGILPPALSQSGLASAVRTLAGSASLAVEVVEVPFGRFDDGAESTVYFVAAEAIANAEKHARASRILLGVHSQPDRLELTVIDDGIGGAMERPGLGLEGLRDRVEGLGGTFELDSVDGHGTRIFAVIPSSARHVPA
jgi:signal transduction histidine kinase